MNSKHSDLYRVRKYIYKLSIKFVQLLGICFKSGDIEYKNHSSVKIERSAIRASVFQQ